ncbi:MAG: lipopolysaccharide heptosyltransferase I [Cocleimonas sp.]|nr:lipopolysaccharide heptosyltransferase I [Cocleimonas sp.]
MADHLIIKTSSLGDIVHMLPALTDAARCIPSIQFDWVVEENFAPVPRWHPNVNRVISLAIRRWRKDLRSKQTRQQVKQFKQQLQQQHYKKIIDTQGLIKSAVVTRWAKGERWGYDKNSITESLACWFYQKTVSVSRQRHAITRNREILAQTLGYSIKNLPLDYGISADQNTPLPQSLTPTSRYLIAFHATSREDKEWSLTRWDAFIPQITQQGYCILFPWGNQREYQRAKQLAETHHNVICLPQCSLDELATLTQRATAVIGMDTGLMHIAAAFNQRGIALYPVTQPQLTGVLTTTPNKIESLSGKDALDVDFVANKMLSILGF